MSPVQKAHKGRSALWREIKPRFTKAFAAMRRRGVYGRTTRLSCCISCMGREYDRSLREDQSYVGYNVQTCPEDQDSPFEGLYMQHFLADSDDEEIVFQKLKNNGLAPVWSGSHDEAIFVRLPLGAGSLWKKLRAHVLLRSIAFYLMELSQRSACAEGGSGRETDLAAFEEDFSVRSAPEAA